jgi:hypothetical protein
VDLQDTLEPRYEGFAFGVDNRRMARALRQFAEDLDSGRVALQQTKLIENARNDDFFQKILIIRFAERFGARDPEPQTIDG